MSGTGVVAQSGTLRWLGFFCVVFSTAWIGIHGETVGFSAPLLRCYAGMDSYFEEATLACKAHESDSLRGS